MTPSHLTPSHLLTEPLDPQTSGGLLISVEKESAGELVNELKKKGIDDAAVIGEVLTEPKERIVMS